MRLGVDVGEARIGVAASDPDGLLATPVETIRVADGHVVERLAELAAERRAVEVVVGLPVTLRGRVGTAAAKATALAERLRVELDRRGLAVVVRLVDERLSTVSAEQHLRSGGRRGAARRAVVDQAAAVVILQHALDTQRVSGRPAGTVVRGTP